MTEQRIEAARGERATVSGPLRERLLSILGGHEEPGASVVPFRAAAGQLA